jgi:hypothetical protein
MIVFDETQFSKSIHKEVDPLTGYTNHLGQNLLADIRYYSLGPGALVQSGEQQKGSRESLLSGIEQLISQILLNSPVPRN